LGINPSFSLARSHFTCT